MFAQMSENINYNDFKNICRTCMLHCDIKFIRDHVISNVFFKLTNVHFQTNDDLPQQICLKCFEKIYQIHEFSIQCKQSQSTLIKCLNNFKESQLNKDVVENSDDVELNELVIKLGTNIIIDKSKIKCEEDLNIHSTNNSNNELEEIEVIPENNNLQENIFPNTQEININQIKNCSEEETEEQSNSNTTLYDLNKDINSSSNTLNSVIIQTEIDEKMSIPPSTHKNESLFKCETCSKTYRHLSNLVIHKRTHTGERPYVCNQCPKTYNRSNALRIHIRTHSDERPFQCQQCPKKFPTTIQLGIHERVHSGERPYKCKECSKTFKFSGNLSDHMRLHNGRYRFKCELCPKKFNRADYLKEHIRSHNGERPYICKVCSKAFSFSNRLKTHMHIHTDAPYKCSLCDKEFNYIRSLRRHILQKHTSDKPDN